MVLVWFWKEIIEICFQKGGIVLVLRAMYVFVRYLVASGLGCFICLIVMPSGSVVLLFVLFKVLL